ncbi:ABC transporter b family member 19 [Phtheirospermum japonicum]|uniref:ABC transporter b family member 19 n=1 Tax=Phtheirospermum japonicum TaxID=374723 RepID=A0A830D2Z2_9LAMI|nr:ABC transporter b family member 19 [Phtheirospermum japonicum]
MERISGVVATIRRTNPLQAISDMRKTRQQVSYTGRVGDARYPASKYGYTQVPSLKKKPIKRKLVEIEEVESISSSPLNNRLLNEKQYYDHVDQMLFDLRFHKDWRTRGTLRYYSEGFWHDVTRTFNQIVQYAGLHPLEVSDLISFMDFRRNDYYRMRANNNFIGKAGATFKRCDDCCNIPYFPRKFLSSSLYKRSDVIYPNSYNQSLPVGCCRVGNFIHYLPTFLAGLVVGFVSAWKLALLSVAVIPGIAFAGGLYAYTLTGLTSKSRQSYASAGIIAEQSIVQVRTVYSYVGESKALSAYSDLIQNTLKLGYKAGMAKGLGLGCTYGIACMSWALVFWCGGIFIRNGQTDGGKAFTAIFSAIVGGMSLGQSFSNLGAFSKGKVAGYKLMEMIKQKPMIVQDTTDAKCLNEVVGNIEFKNVTFSYPSRPDIIIFRDFSIFFPAGKTVAIVGGSGSGKCTIVSLIERFYDPNQGEILLDNVDIKTLQLKWLRNQIGLVNQEPALFATTILENILYGKPDVTTQEVEAAASAANAHSFITLLPNGYNTQDVGL